MLTPQVIKQTLKRDYGYGAQREIAVFLGVSDTHVHYVIGNYDKRLKQVVRREDPNVQREIAKRLGLSVRQVFGNEAPPADIWPKKQRTRRVAK